MVEENKGQSEGRRITIRNAIKKLQEFFPNEKVDHKNYQNKLRLWLSQFTETEAINSYAPDELRNQLLKTLVEPKISKKFISDKPQKSIKHSHTQYY
ncbi:hypothetical protein BH10PAT1_BH10PAT1_6780 [soil metagenome]